MKIGVMLRSIGEPGGITVYTLNLLKALFAIDDDHEYLLLYRRSADAGRFQRVPNVREVVVRAPHKLLWDQVAVPYVAQREKLDLIFNPKLTVPLWSPCSTVFTMPGAEQFVVPQVFKWHDRLYFTVANPLYCRAASAVIVMTERGAQDVVSRMGADPLRVHAIHQSYNESCSPMPKEKARWRTAGYDLPDRFILFVGGITPLKNFGNLLRAFRLVAEVIPHHLVAAGFKRWKYARDLALIQDLGLEDRVSFLGFVPNEDLPALYNLAEAFVMPSLYEGFGMPVLEAMACRCPVITTNTGCSPEVAGEAAILVDPYEPRDIAAGILQLLRDERLREHLIKQGLDRARDFSWKKCASETLALFESVAGHEVEQARKRHSYKTHLRRQSRTDGSHLK